MRSMKASFGAAVSRVASAEELRRLASIAMPAIVAAVLCTGSSATTGDTIRVWKVGSPHRDNTPAATVPFALSQEATRRGFRITVEPFPARGFAATFSDAVTRNAAPDVLVFDNYGVMGGITTERGKFQGLGEEPALRRPFLRITGAFDEFLGPERGWTYLFRSSANHEAARALALKAPECPNGSSGPTLLGELGEIVPSVVTAYLRGDALNLQTYSDPDRLSGGGPSAGPAGEWSRSERIQRVGVLRPCGLWGNDRVAFVSVNALYEAETTLGHTPVLLVFRKPAAQWRLLVASRDPISNGAFVTDVPSVTATLAGDGQTRALPIPATLRSPVHAASPSPSGAQRFGTFTWWSSPSDDVAAEIIEFAYHDDARLFLTRQPRPGSPGQMSAGRLWTTGSEWSWRIWSISRTGDVAFSDARMFPH